MGVRLPSVYLVVAIVRHNLLCIWRSYPTMKERDRKILCPILHVGGSHEATEWMAAVGAHTISLSCPKEKKEGFTDFIEWKLN